MNYLDFTQPFYSFVGFVILIFFCLLSPTHNKWADFVIALIGTFFFLTPQYASIIKDKNIPPILVIATTIGTLFALALIVNPFLHRHGKNVSANKE